MEVVKKIESVLKLTEVPFVRTGLLITPPPTGCRFGRCTLVTNVFERSSWRFGFILLFRVSNVGRSGQICQRFLDFPEFKIYQGCWCKYYSQRHIGFREKSSRFCDVPTHQKILSRAIFDSRLQFGETDFLPSKNLLIKQEPM